MEFLAEYGMFLAKALTLVFCVLLVFGNLIPMVRGREQDERGNLKVTKVNDRWTYSRDQMHALMVSGKARKQAKKESKKRAKEQAKQAAKADSDPAKKGRGSGSGRKPRLYCMNFKGDIQAKATASLREEVTAILSVARPDDEVVVNIESPGGIVHGYGFAASQLDRVRKAGVSLVAVVDKVAASGGYMMACVADRIHAAPFAVIGSVGVVAQLPNFHRLLDKHDIDFELHTAGDHKRTLTLFGENTEAGRQKFREDLEEAHSLFKAHIGAHRSGLDVDAIATGEIWFGTKALEMGLVDEIETSDEYILSRVEDYDIFEVQFVPKKRLHEKLSQNVENSVSSVVAGLISRIRSSRYLS